MIAPATASTGITLLTPISGASAAVRMIPVPKPPMPPTTAATIATAATSASVGASSSTSSVARHRARPPGTVDGDVGERRLGDLHDLGIGGPALRVNLYGDGDGRRADALDLDVERDEIADLHGLLEHELLHRHGRDAPARDAPGGGAAGDIDLRHDPAAEDVAVLVRVRRHRHDAQRRLLTGELFHARDTAAARRGTGRTPCRR